MKSLLPGNPRLLGFKAFGHFAVKKLTAYTSQEQEELEITFACQEKKKKTSQRIKAAIEKHLTTSNASSCLMLKAFQPRCFHPTSTLTLPWCALPITSEHQVRSPGRGVQPWWELGAALDPAGGISRREKPQERLLMHGRWELQLVSERALSRSSQQRRVPPACSWCFVNVRERRTGEISPLPLQTARVGVRAALA